ncbi:HlyD family secretion protein [Niabella sp. W65]|nr:HlyD family secretion protein [Niabella sp. W65]MCH7365686.1 HlyD family secretion protein [Niabella sp. W65]
MSRHRQMLLLLKKKKSYIFIILAVMIVLGAYFGISGYIHGQRHEETDDAQVEANLSPVISKISGYVSEVRVRDNQFVNRGDTLLILDKRDLTMALQQAEAALGTARSNLSSSEASTTATHKNIGTADAAVATANAQIEAAKVNVWRTGEDLKRYENLIKDHSITQQQYEQALAAKQSADKQLEILVAQRNQAAAQTSVVKSQVAASSEQSAIARSGIRQKEVEVENAKLNLSYTVITAAESGVVSKVPVQVGQFIQAGAQLFNIVLSNEKWVVANFKETQIAKMVEGQKVSVKVDAFPRHEFEARLTSFSPATGARFALLPPDNASGNFVKVVQRLPVKIEFTDKNDSLIQKLRPGLNVVVDVHLN